MCRKMSLKKIENVTKCQVTFSKRRSSLIKKSQEISICCDAEVAFIAFSPSGRISKFSGPKRFEEVIDRYVNLPADMKYNDMDNVQEKLEKLRQLDHIKGDRSKLYYLDKQVENLELQIKKSTLQLQILETQIRIYEPQEQEQEQEHEPTLSQLLWHERNIKNSLGKVIGRKNIISAGFPLARGQKNNLVACETLKPYLTIASHEKLPMRLDPWLVPDSAEVDEGLLQSVINQESRKSIRNQGIAISTSDSTHRIAEQIQPQLHSKFQPPHPLIAHESQFVPPVENVFRSVAQSAPEIPSWSLFGNGSFSQTLHDIQPANLERTTPLRIEDNLCTTFAFNNGPLAIDKTHARNHQIYPVSCKFKIGINNYYGTDTNNPTIFENKNIHITGKIGNGHATEEPNPPPAVLSDKFSFENFSKDDTPCTSVGKSGLFDREWDSFTYEDRKHLLD